jgi:uncharacterized protein YndB with AHSA1/START domain
MADILQDFPIRAPIGRVFDAVSKPGGLDQWWTKRSAGEPFEGSEYELAFGPEYDWRARVATCIPPSRFELILTRADGDWNDTRVRFTLESREGSTWVRFQHAGWPEANEHFRVSQHCWAMYLRVLRRWLEHGEMLAYEDRLDA